MKVNSGARSSTKSTKPPQRRTQAQRTAATRGKLLSAGRKLFADKGFANVTTEQIVAAAGVTRGALYHQFDNKTELFAAVDEEVERDLVAGLAERIALARPPDAVAAMRVGTRLFFELCAAPEVRRIVLIDAPAVLGWERWRAVGMQYGLGVIETMLRQAIADGAVPDQPTRPSAHVLLGALDEAALYISRAPDPEQAREEMGRICDRLIDGIAGVAGG
jgi:AcrR family transcriptional regulator